MLSLPIGNYPWGYGLKDWKGLSLEGILGMACGTAVVYASPSLRTRQGPLRLLAVVNVATQVVFSLAAYISRSSEKKSNSGQAADLNYSRFIGCVCILELPVAAATYYATQKYPEIFGGSTPVASVPVLFIAMLVVKFVCSLLYPVLQNVLTPEESYNWDDSQKMSPDAHSRVFKKGKNTREFLENISSMEPNMRMISIANTYKQQLVQAGEDEVFAMEDDSKLGIRKGSELTSIQMAWISAFAEHKGGISLPDLLFQNSSYPETEDEDLGNVSCEVLHTALQTLGGLTGQQLWWLERRLEEEDGPDLVKNAINFCDTGLEQFVKATSRVSMFWSDVEPRNKWNILKKIQEFDLFSVLPGTGLFLSAQEVHVNLGLDEGDLVLVKKALESNFSSNYLNEDYQQRVMELARLSLSPGEEEINAISQALSNPPTEVSSQVFLKAWVMNFLNSEESISSTFTHNIINFFSDEDGFTLESSYFLPDSLGDIICDLDTLTTPSNPDRIFTYESMKYEFDSSLLASKPLSEQLETNLKLIKRTGVGCLVHITGQYDDFAAMVTKMELSDTDRLLLTKGLLAQYNSPCFYLSMLSIHGLYAYQFNMDLWEAFAAQIPGLPSGRQKKLDSNGFGDFVKGISELMSDPSSQNQGLETSDSRVKALQGIYSNAKTVKRHLAGLMGLKRKDSIAIANYAYKRMEIIAVWEIPLSFEVRNGN